MSVYKDENRNSWYAVVRVTDPLTGKKKQIKKRGFITKREAKAWEAEQMRNPEIKTSITFHQVADAWEKSSQVSPEQEQKHRAHFRIRFAEHYDRPIMEITKLQLEKWRTDLIDDPSSTKTKNDTITFVKSVFRYGSEFYGLPNTAQFLKMMKKTAEEQTKEMKVWTPEQFYQFLSCEENLVYRLYYETVFWTGMRRGEALALQKTDLQDGCLYIHGSIKHFKNGIKPTKTKQTRRIRIDTKLAEDLQILMQTEGPFLFGGEQSLPLSGVYSRWKKAIKESGVEPIRLHDLRHSHASWLINNGVNIIAVSKRLGHSTINETLKTYTHLLESTDNEMMDKIENYRKCYQNVTTK